MASSHIMSTSSNHTSHTKESRKTKSLGSSAATPTNTLVLVLPPALFSDKLLPLFRGHFANYGNMSSWSAIESWGRVLVVYDSVAGAKEAKEEMNGFVWDEPEDLNGEDPVPIRVYYGPSISSQQASLLTVPESATNFLISPPGSPPVGWEQVVEDSPNPNPFSVGDDAWMAELERALRFLSVSTEVDDVPQEPLVASEDGTTTLIPLGNVAHPALTLSSPRDGEAALGSNSKITLVKATAESMHGKPAFAPTARPPC